MSLFKKILLTSLLSFVLCPLSSCSNGGNDGGNLNGTQQKMKDALDLYYSETKNGIISDTKFYLKADILFGTKAGDYDFRRLSYSFSYGGITLNYKDEFGISGKRDIFRNELNRRDSVYVCELTQPPLETTISNCVISFSYSSYTVSNTLSVTINGGLDLTSSQNGWTKNNSSTYTYYSTQTLTDSIDRPTDVTTRNGTINLDSLTYNYSIISKKYVNGIYSHVGYHYEYSYDADSGLMNVVDRTKSNNVQTKSISLKNLSNEEKYNSDKANGWNWEKINYCLDGLKVFDSLLVGMNLNDLVSVFYNSNYSHTYLFQLS